MLFFGGEASWRLGSDFNSPSTNWNFAKLIAGATQITFVRVNSPSRLWTLTLIHVIQNLPWCFRCPPKNTVTECHWANCDLKFNWTTISFAEHRTVVFHWTDWCQPLSNNLSSFLLSFTIWHCSETLESGKCLCYRRPLGGRDDSDIFMAFNLTKYPLILPISRSSKTDDQHCELPIWVSIWHIPNCVASAWFSLLSILRAFVQHCQMLMGWNGSVARTEENRRQEIH